MAAQQSSSAPAKQLAAKRPAKKRYRACRGVNLLTPEGEVRFEPGDEITCPIPGKAVAAWLPRGIIEEVN